MRVTCLVQCFESCDTLRPCSLAAAEERVRAVLRGGMQRAMSCEKRRKLSTPPVEADGKLHDVAKANARFVDIHCKVADKARVANRLFKGQQFRCRPRAVVAVCRGGTACLAPYNS